MVKFLQLVHEINSFSEVLYKRGVLKIFPNSQISTGSNRPEVFCQKIFSKVLQNSQKYSFAGDSFLIKLQAGSLKLSEAATGDVL